MRRCLPIILMLAALAVSSPAPLAAADEHDKKHVDEKTLGVETGLFKGAVELSVWTIVVFLLLLWVLHKYAWGPILSGLQQREESIARDKREAEHARREAAEARAKVEAEMARVNAEINQMISKARQDAAATASEELARGKVEVQAERDRLHREMNIEHDQALQDVWSKSVQLAALISSKAIGKHLSDADHRVLLDEALVEFRAAGQARVAEIQSARA
jgi:F-type H+-transporting ATPase subunit b